MSDVAAAPRLRLHTKVSYGLGSVAQAVAGVALSTSIINFYLVRVLGLRPAIVGTVILVSLVVDAMLDPAIGRISDTFRSPWGRRHPFMYASAAPIAIAIFLLWRQPAGLSPAALAAYALFWLIAVRLCSGFYQIPSDSLTPELAPDYHERTSLISFRYFFGIFGGVGMTVLLLNGLLRKDAAHPLGMLNRAGYAEFGLIASITVFVAIIVSSAATHRYIPYLAKPQRRRQSFGRELREVWGTLTHPAMVVVMIAGLVSGIGGGISASLGNFMSLYFWGLTPQVIGYIAIFGAPASIIGVMAAPLVSRWLDKKRAMLTVFFAAIFTGVIPPILRLTGVLQLGSPWIPPTLVADSFISGTLSLIGYVIIGSMVADVVEDNAVRTGVRAEGVLFATSGLLPKVTVGVGGLIGNLMLEAVHFPSSAATSGALDHVAWPIMRNLTLLSVPSQMALNIVAVSVLFLYRLDRSTHEANLEALRLAAEIGEPPTSLGAATPPELQPDVLGRIE
jgi:glycoside/pentoside/hexuronide:cation symporter, GPH family